ncbi:FtsJ-like methyltransferase [Popillia japonica]|uniref:Cap-specific mRNA (nucleoside-2'-O-)-methyltransferase 2 n=1 Tax=Popillia japonica TaxID=7064 RepID=A0AAW1IWB7_POPJA
MRTSKGRPDKDVRKYFDRRFEFKKDSWNLPASKDVYKENKFIIPDFQRLKDELNGVKAQLNEFDIAEWSNHTKHRDPSTSIISTIKLNFKAELVTQAWCKFYECLSEFSVISKNSIEQGMLNSVHICEAPGAFICALNHYIKTQIPEIEWDWLGTTLNPYYEGNPEMIPDDRLIRHTYKNWYFGSDLTGDITKYYNFQALVGLVKTKMKQVHLVTADGSIDCMCNPGDQERLVEYLHYCEVMIALHILETGGSLVIKIFTMFEESTICLMYLLNYCFEKVHIFKPCTSKSGNSELYVICLNYTPMSEAFMSALLVPYIEGKFKEKSMFSLDHISPSFLEQMNACASFFMDKQIRVINENIKYFRNVCYKQKRWITNLTSNVVDYFLNKYRIFPLSHEAKVVTGRKVHAMYHMAEFFLTKEEDITYCNNINIDKVNISSILDIQIGKYIVNLYHSKYHTTTNYSYNQNKTNKDLYNLIRPMLSNTCSIITFSDFDQFYGVSKFHRIFFFEIYHNFTHRKNMLIVGIPLLTSFLVGLVFLISLAFERMWFLNNVIVLETPQKSKINDIRKHLDVVYKTYEDIDKMPEIFTKDILHLIPFECIYNRRFIKLVSQYNECILKYRYNQ